MYSFALLVFVNMPVIGKNTARKIAMVVTGSSVFAGTAYGVYHLFFAKTEQEKNVQVLEDLDTQACELMEDGGEKHLADIYHKIVGNLTLLSNETQQKLDESVVAFDVARVSSKQEGREEHIKSAYQGLSVCLDICKKEITSSDKSHANWRGRTKQQLNTLRKKVVSIFSHDIS